MERFWKLGLSQLREVEAGLIVSPLTMGPF